MSWLSGLLLLLEDVNEAAGLGLAQGDRLDPIGLLAELVNLRLAHAPLIAGDGVDSLELLVGKLARQAGHAGRS